MLSKLCVRSSTKNTNEDAIWVKEEGEYIRGVCSDGCSDSINSSFASRLICYLFEKHFSNAFTINSFHIRLLINDLREFTEILPIGSPNLLATFIPFIYHIPTEELRIRIFGDGAYYINGREFIIEQDNTPDYIGYQVDQIYASNMIYIDKYPELVYNDVKSFTICSDGISSFSANQFENGDSTEVYKLLEPPLSENYLQRIYNILKGKKFTNSDDVSIISYIKE